MNYLIIPTKYKSLKYLLLLFFILLLWRCINYILLPNPGVDGPVYLSHAFSVLNGKPFENDFLKEYIPTYNFPYLFGFLNAPFYFIFTGTWFQPYSIFFWNIIWIILFLYGCHFILKKKESSFEKFTLIAVVFLVNVYSNSLRSEIFILPFLVLLLQLLKNTFEKNKKIFRFFCTPLLIAVIGLMHPVAGVFACVFVLLFAIDKRIAFTKFLPVFILCVFYLAILYLPVISIDLESWKLNFIQRGFIERTHSVTDFSVFLKYASYNPSFVLLIFFILFHAKNFYKEILSWAIIFFTLSYFHQSYYFHYLFVFILWRLSETPGFNISLFFKTGFILTFLYGVGLSYLLLTFQVAENYAYAKTYKKVITYLHEHETENGGKKVWVSGEIAMPVIDRANTRLHWPFIADYKSTMQPVDTNSIFYLDHLDQLEYIKKYAFVQNTHIVVSQLIAPVQGLLTISINAERSSAIGLWKIRVAPD